MMLQYISVFAFLCLGTSIAGPVDTTPPEIDGVLKHLLEKARQQIQTEVKEQMDGICKSFPGWEDDSKFSSSGSLEKIGLCKALMFYRENQKLGRTDPTTKIISSQKVKERFAQISKLLNDENTKNFYAKFVDALQQCEDGRKPTPQFEVDISKLPETIIKEEAELAKKSLQLQLCGFENSLPKGTTLQNASNKLTSELKWMQKSTGTTAESDDEKQVKSLITGVKEDMRRKIASGCYTEVNEICKADSNWPSEVKYSKSGDPESIGNCIAVLHYCESKKLGMLNPETGVLSPSKLKERYDQLIAMESSEIRKKDLGAYSDCVQQCADGKFTTPKFSVDTANPPKGITQDEAKKSADSLYLQVCGLKCRLPPNITVEKAYESMKSELHYVQEAAKTGA